MTTSRDDLVPWQIEKAHLWAYPLMMLRFEQRRRAGHELEARMEARLRRWRQERQRDCLVVDYDPRSEAGFRLVPRRPGIDLDLIREPGRGRAGNFETGRSTPRSERT